MHVALRESHLSSWQAIETAPKDGSDFIGMRRDGERLLTHTTRMALYSGHHLWECLEFDAVSPWSPTHWMPLPGIATVETSEERLNQAWKKDGEIIGNAMAERVREMAKETTAKPLTCGCVVCTCEDEVRCQGCGAKYCEQHAVNRTERHL
jgi:hypothetical protein